MSCMRDWEYAGTIPMSMNLETADDILSNQARTSTTELSVPFWFQTFSFANGSGIHCPSTMNLY